MGLDFVRVGIAEDLLGKKDGKRFLPILDDVLLHDHRDESHRGRAGLNIAGTSVIRSSAGTRRYRLRDLDLRRSPQAPGKFLRNALFPPGATGPLPSS
jgi:F-type H+-transporting ATPase subunit a